MASRLLENSPPSPENLDKNQRGGTPQSIEELLVSDEFYPIMSAMLRPIAVTVKLPASSMEDVLQEVCLAILEHLDRHDKNVVQQWRGWMRQVMRNKTVDVLRHPRRRTVSLDALALEPTAPKGVEIEQDRRKWMAERLEEMAEDESLNTYLLLQRFRNGRTNKELAVATGSTEKRVECRICRKIGELRQEATKYGLIAPSPQRVTRRDNNDTKAKKL